MLTDTVDETAHMLVRPETPADLAAVRTLTLATSYRPLPEETEELRLRDALRSADARTESLPGGRGG